jgi:membrane-bound serine protease (ClpP class)
MEWDLITALIAAGIVLLLVEIFVPGMVLGTIGVGCLIASVIATYVKYGPEKGTIVFVSEVFALAVALAVWGRIYPRTPMGKAMILTEQNKTRSAPDTLKTLLGQEGISSTPLRPSGIAIFNAKRYDVVSENNFISPGETIKVVAVEGSRVVVRAIPQPAVVSA